jgi:hypothetical protein
MVETTTNMARDRSTSHDHKPDETTVLMSEEFTPAELQEFQRRLLERKAKKLAAAKAASTRADQV